MKIDELRYRETSSCHYDGVEFWELAMGLKTFGVKFKSKTL